jgi:hypothetical protein
MTALVGVLAAGPKNRVKFAGKTASVGDHSHDSTGQ